MIKFTKKQVSLLTKLVPVTLGICILLEVIIKIYIPFIMYVLFLAFQTYLVFGNHEDNNQPPVA